MSVQVKQTLLVDVAGQTLSLVRDGALVHSWSVSTAANGLGCREGSFQTPIGAHRIRAKIGAGEPLNTVFIGRRPTGEIYGPQLAQEFPQRDWVLSRILWLCGEEKGLNRGADVDSQRRYIYIHGTPDSEPMGVPRSHGCIRMRNQDVIHLFDLVQCGDSVLIS